MVASPDSLTPQQELAALRPRGDPQAPYPNRFSPLRDVADDEAYALRLARGLRSSQVDGQRALFLAAQAEGHSVRESARLAEVHTWRVYVWEKTDPEFRAAWERVKAGTVPLLESNLDRLAQGDGMPAFLSTAMRLKALDARYRDRYAEPSTTQINVTIAAAVQLARHRGEPDIPQLPSANPD